MAEVSLSRPHGGAFLNSFTYFSFQKSHPPSPFNPFTLKTLSVSVSRVRKKALSHAYGRQAKRILLRPALRDYGGQVAPAYAKASAGKHGA